MRIICQNECRPEKPRRAKSGWSLLTGVLVLVMPKCALCWAAYMGVLGSFGIVIKYQAWFLPVVIILFLFTLFKLLIGSLRSGSFLAFGMALIAAILILSQREVPEATDLKLLAIGLMIGSLAVNKMTSRKVVEKENDLISDFK